MILTLSLPSTNTIAIFILVFFCGILSARNYFLVETLNSIATDHLALAQATEQFVIAQKQLNVNQVEGNRHFFVKIANIEAYLINHEKEQQDILKRELISNGIHIVHEGQLSTLQSGKTVSPIQGTYVHGTQSP